MKTFITRALLASLICIGGNSTTGIRKRARVMINTPRACTTAMVLLER